VLLIGQQLERAHSRDEEGHRQHVEQGDAQLAGAVDDVVAVDQQILGEPGAPRELRPHVGPDHDVDVVDGRDPDAARVDSQAGAVRRQ
jgi:hypothetical protein